MTAGVRFIPQAPRCGCCDRAQAFAVCERCNEPTCVEHFVRIIGADQTPSYICAVCAEAMANLDAAESAEVVA